LPEPSSMLYCLDSKMNEIEPIRSVDRLLEIARTTVKKAAFAFLVTFGADGNLYARLMQPFPPDEQFVVWMGTSRVSRKVAQLQRDDRATLAYERVHEGAYVTLMGTATIVDDLALRRRYWLERWRGFWPAGPEDDDYILLRFTAFQLELKNDARGVSPQSHAQEMAILRKAVDGHGNYRWVTLDMQDRTAGPSGVGH
jgi:general stress protein 26